MAPKFSGGARYKSRTAGWQQSTFGPAGWDRIALAVSLSLVVLDLDLDVLGLVGEIVGVLQGLVIGLQVRRLLRDILHLLALRQCQLGGCCGSGGRSGSRRRAAAATDFHEVLAVVLTAALGAFYRTLVQVIEARCTILAGALGTPGRLDHVDLPEIPL